MVLNIFAWRLSITLQLKLSYR